MLQCFALLCILCEKVCMPRGALNRMKKMFIQNMGLGLVLGSSLIMTLPLLSSYESKYRNLCEGFLKYASTWHINTKGQDSRK